MNVVLEVLTTPEVFLLFLSCHPPTNQQTIAKFLFVPDYIMLVTWIPPEGWTVPQPAVHRSFDTADGLVLMEGTQPANFPFIEGKVIIQCVHSVSNIKF